MVSIVIPFYKRLEHLRCCLDSLSLCAKDFDEVVVSDDGSDQGTVNQLHEMIKKYAFSVKYVWQPKKGFRVAAARNNGIRHAKGEYLIFLDCDLLVLPGTIKHHLSLARKGRFVAGHCKYLGEDRSNAVMQSPISPEILEKHYGQIPEREIIKTHRRFIKRTILIRFGLLSHRKQSLGGHFSIYREDIERVNGYDESYVGWGGEDEDLGIRLVKAGIYGRSGIRGARALHMWHPKELGEKHWEQGPNVNYFRRKNRPLYCKNGLIKAGF